MKKINRGKILFTLMLLLFSCNVFSQGKSYKVKLKYECSPEEPSKCTLSTIDIYNDSLVKISTINYDASSSFLSLNVLRHIRQERVGYTSYNSLGDVIKQIEPEIDSISKIYKLIPIDITEFCQCPKPANNGSGNVKCKWDKYGNVIEEIHYSPNNRKRILSKYVYQYIY